jgi:hypothetical protein
VERKIWLGPRSRYKDEEDIISKASACFHSSLLTRNSFSLEQAAAQSLPEVIELKDIRRHHSYSQ